MAGPITAIPEGFTIWDKVVVDHRMKIGEFKAYMKEKYSVNITLISCGKIALYNEYLPGKKHAPRLERYIEELYNEISDEKLPAGRYYLPIELGGDVEPNG